ncbi:unnamed protein product [Plutella xylostella]|uniref:(diamondback moth) hypothetical protein n=1 Tax=Plutella xylostella TaxID=51655 RepID=A0A8S4G914_PLUXY|nr:unnamed protein product [Plutella xylostella]
MALTQHVLYKKVYSAGNSARTSDFRICEPLQRSSAERAPGRRASERPGAASERL